MITHHCGCPLTLSESLFSLGWKVEQVTGAQPVNTDAVSCPIKTGLEFHGVLPQEIRLLWPHPIPLQRIGSQSRRGRGGPVSLPFHLASVSAAQGSNTLAEDSLVQVSEDVLVLTLQLLSLSYFPALMYTAPCQLRRHCQVKTPQPMLMGQGQKLVSVVSRGISRGQALSNWDKRTGEDGRGGDRGTCSHMLGGPRGLVPWAYWAWYL